MNNWTLDSLKKSLDQHPEIKCWAVNQEHTHRRERYFMKSNQSPIGIDQDRESRVQNIIVQVLVNLPEGGRQGEIVKKFFPSLSLEPQIQSAVAAAKQTSQAPWSFPEKPVEPFTEIQTADPRIAEDIDRVMDEMTAQVSEALSEKQKAEFNSAEIFLALHDQEVHMSSGLQHRSSRSRIYAEAAYSFEEKGSQSDEYVTRRWATRLSDLSLKELFTATSDYAEKTVSVVKPQTGRYAVIVDSDVLSTVLNSTLCHFSAFSAYHKLPFISPGKEFIPGARGDLLSMTLDPTLDFGADSVIVSNQGVAQKPLVVVSENRVQNSLADQQYATYLNQKPTTVRGDIVVGEGHHSYEELTQAAPQVIEILQFSALFVEPHSGTFSSEIRLARLFDNESGKVHYLKGGSLSGSIFENFRDVRLTKNRIRRAEFETARFSGILKGKGYDGPDYALLNDVSIVG